MAKTVFPNHITEETAKVTFPTKANPVTTGSFAHGMGIAPRGANSFVTGTYNAALPSAQTWVSGTHYKVGDLVDLSGTVYECIIENTDQFFTQRKWRKYSEKYAEIVGNGTTSVTRSNARTLDWDGNEWLAGSLTLGNTTLTEEKLQQLLALLS